MAAVAELGLLAVMHMATRNQKAYDDWAASYDSDANPHTLIEHAEVVKAVDAQKDEMILDAACGTGKYSREFVSRCARVTGVDFSPKMLSVARKKCPGVRFIEADITRRLPFVENHFGKINCAQALKHIRRLGPVIKEFHRVLKPEGLLTFSVTHPDMNWDGYAMTERPSFVLPEQSDIYHHRFCDYLSAIERGGFQIDAIIQVRVSAKIKHLLTEESFKKVKGRCQVVIFKLLKRSEMQRNGPQSQPKRHEN